MAFGPGLRAATVSLLLASGAGHAAAAQDAAAPATPGEVQSVANGLLTLAIGNRIRRACETIVPRRIAAFAFMNRLAAQARAAGFSETEIRAYVEDESEEARIKALAEEWLRQHGAREGEPQSYCTIGQREIAEGSTIGRLLRSN